MLRTFMAEARRAARPTAAGILTRRADEGGWARYYLAAKEFCSYESDPELRRDGR